MKTPNASQHGSGGEPSPTANVPEPPFAERARTLIHLGRTATLATQSRRHAGYPFGSVMPYAADTQGRPVLLISRMAMHTQNLDADARASLLVTQAGWDQDPLAGSRLTCVGHIRPVGAADLAAVRAGYLERHDNARFWVDFDDFGFYRMEIVDLYFVAGFGAMGWVAATDFALARPDPLAESAASIIEHMNADHAEALVLYCKAFAGVEVESATMTGVDRLGFRVRAKRADQMQALRINFPSPAASVKEARTLLVEMVARARKQLS